MSKKIILALSIVLFLFSYNFVFASLIINEIMYNPPAGQKSGDWFEVYNTGPDIIIQSDKTQRDNPWKFFKVGLSTKYYINSPDFTIKSGEYVIFSDDSSIFSDDYTISAKVIDSAVSLSNSNKTTLQILDESGVPIASAEYDPSKDLAAGDGNSLQLMNDKTWKAVTPTPGIKNEIETTSPPSANNSSGNESSSNSSSSSSSGNSVSSSSGNAKAVEIKKIKTQITAKTLGFVGLPLSFLATTYGYSGEQLHYGKYFWNFGDGDSKEMQVNGSEKLAHTYFYPGDYAVSLDYFSNPYIYSNIPDASDQIIIKIIKADISISRVGDEKDFFVELTNNTGYDTDLSNWALSSDAKSFTIPRNTILASKKKMIISPKITNFSIADKNTLKLMNSEREVIFDYSLSVVQVIPAKIVVENMVPEKLLVSKAKNINKNNTNGAMAENVTKNLPVLALSSESVKPDKKNKYSFPIFPIASFVFIGASAGAVYFIRRKKVIPKAGDDFEILDE